MSVFGDGAERVSRLNYVWPVELDFRGFSAMESGFWELMDSYRGRGGLFIGFRVKLMK